MKDMPRPLQAALESLRKAIGPALILKEGDLVLATCFKCGRDIWVLNQAGPAVLLDAIPVFPTDDLRLGIHPCFTELFLIDAETEAFADGSIGDPFHFESDVDDRQRERND